MTEFHQLALVELQQAYTWYRERSPEAAERFSLQTNLALDRLEEDPGSHARVGWNCHCLRISRFPYLLIYRIKVDGGILVLAVAHASRRSGYWRNRKSP